MPIATEQFDYIVVGAGSSGCVLVDRLSADGRSTVLVIEAGGVNDSPMIAMPRGFITLLGKPEYFWTFPTKLEAGFPGGGSWIYGKGLGGSSAVNGTRYLRGMPSTPGLRRSGRTAHLAERHGSRRPNALALERQLLDQIEELAEP